MALGLPQRYLVRTFQPYRYLHSCFGSFQVERFPDGLAPLGGDGHDQRRTHPRGLRPEGENLLTPGKWELDGVWPVVDYSHNCDYSLSQGGTGKTLNVLCSTLIYGW
jgi:hypothetical protein